MGERERGTMALIAARARIIAAAISLVGAASLTLVARAQLPGAFAVEHVGQPSSRPGRTGNSDAGSGQSGTGTGSAAGASRPYPGGSRNERMFTSARYRVIFDTDESAARELAAHMDKVYDEYSRRFSSFGRRGSEKLDLRIFQTNAAYLAHLRNQGFNAMNTGGVFYTNERETGLATFIDGQEHIRLLHTLQHEGFHQYAAERFGGLPIWVNEGIAEFFGHGYLVKGKLEIGGVDSDTLDQVALAVKQNKHIPFSQMCTMTGEDWNKRVATQPDAAGLQYDQAWSMVHFLIEGENGKYVGYFEDYLRKIAQGVQPGKAFTDAFGEDAYADFEAKWKRHVLALKPDPVSTVILRMEFMAQGLKAMHERGVNVDTVEALEKKLNEFQFRLSRTSHGVMRVMRASDRENFKAPIDRSSNRKPATIKLTAPKSGSFPPGIQVEGLKVSLTLSWSRATDGSLDYDIRYQ